jgi:DNA mismatch repair protein MutL
MQKRPIQVLAPAVAERIAAGEVIERPASVVKELVENSLDAGARFVQVSLADGGRETIEVLDNGHGMDPDNLALSVLRHATSKISRLDDLDHLRTLGFRGEALPSISAVAELTIISRAENSDTAYELALGGIESRPAQLKPRATTYGRFVNTSHGTLVRAAGLFAQVPARLKFLKSSAAEVSAVREWLERLALAHPSVSFRFFSDDRKLLDLRPEEEASRVKSVLSPGENFTIATEERESEGIRVRMHWLQGLSLPHSRKLAQVVNGRAIRDRLLQQAMLVPFRQALLPGQFPALALFLELDPADLDVNAHPTKAEVRFREGRRIFAAVEKTTEALIGHYGAAAYVPESWSGFAPGAAASSASDVPIDWSAAPAAQNQDAPLFRAAEPSLAATPGAPIGRTLETELQPGRFLGALFNTYLAYDLGSELVLIDQHAAHERVRYEALRSRVLGRAKPDSQELLLPETARFSPEDLTRVEERLALFEQLGFHVEVFGENTLLFRSVPADWGTHELRVRLQGLLARVLEVPLEGSASSLLIDSALFERLASEACHSSFRAGDRLEREESLHLVSRLLKSEHPWNCPHGRPTFVRIPRAKFEEWFQRSV